LKKPQEPRTINMLVLDTSAFLAGFDPFSLGCGQATVPKVEEEIKKNSIIKTRLETAVESGKLKIKVPTTHFSNLAKKEAAKVGDVFKLSDADLQLLALSLELKSEGWEPQIVTDDYSIQNVAAKLGIAFVALATFGIKRQLKWVKYCPACYREYSANGKSSECQVCGTDLKRKMHRSEDSSK
jgi:UPF0271 protein